MRHCCTQRPRFRGLVPLSVGATASGFLRFNDALALLGLAFLGRSPSMPLGFSGDLRCLVGARKQPPQTAPAPYGTRPRYPHVASPLGHFRNVPVLGYAPCASECQRARKLADLSRGCRPLQGSCPRPRPEGLGVGHPAASLCPQSDTGGQVENTKALERTRVKELGKMVP